MDRALVPTVPGPGRPPSPPGDDWYGGLGVSLGDTEAWKTQKVGGCWWTMCHRNMVLSHVAQDTAPSWFWGCLTQTAHTQAIFGHFWAVSRIYCGGRKHERALDHRAMKAHIKCNNCLPPFDRFDWESGSFLAKNGCFGTQKAQFLECTSRLGAPALGRRR